MSVPLLLQIGTNHTISIMSLLPSIALGLIGAFGQYDTNKKNQAIADRQNRANQKMQEQQNAFNLEMWNKQNAYNDPSEQRKRFERAGLNPALMLGQFSAGQAESLTSAQGHPSVGAQMQNPLAGAVDAYVAGTNAELTKNQAELVKSQKDNQDIKNQYEAARNSIELSKLASDKKLVDKQITYYGAKTDRELLEMSQSKELHPKQLDEIQARIDKMKVDTDVQRVQEKILTEDLKAKPLERQRIAADIAHLYASIKYMAENLYLTKAQTALVYAQAHKTSQEGAKAEVDLKHAEESFDLFLRKTEADIKFADKQTESIDEKLKLGWFGQIMQGLGIGVGAFAALRTMR